MVREFVLDGWFLNFVEILCFDFVWLVGFVIGYSVFCVTLGGFDIVLGLW